MDLNASRVRLRFVRAIDGVAGRVDRQPLKRL